MSPRTSEAGPLEMEVLGIIGEREHATVAEIQRALKKNGKSLAYTTVMTVLVRTRSTSS